VQGRIARQLLFLAEEYGQKLDQGTVLIPIRLIQTDIAEMA
jgi:CRP-like cAMP-binding protein